MEAKLQIHGHSYVLIHEGKTIAFAHPEDFSSDDVIGKLSLKNCEAIKDGYDLDEFYKELDISKSDIHITERHYYKLGFQKAIEILGDKKFSEEQMRMAYGRQFDDSFPVFLQSLQPNEWDVEVATEFVEEEKTGLEDLSWGRLTPELDADGCLILRKI